MAEASRPDLFRGHRGRRVLVVDTGHPGVRGNGDRGKLGVSTVDGVSAAPRLRGRTLTQTRTLRGRIIPAMFLELTHPPRAPPLPPGAQPPPARAGPPPRPVLCRQRRAPRRQRGNPEAAQADAVGEVERADFRPHLQPDHVAGDGRREVQPDAEFLERRPMTAPVAPWTTGTGNSPPARKLASWPL